MRWALAILCALFATSAVASDYVSIGPSVTFNNSRAGFAEGFDLGLSGAGSLDLPLGFGLFGAARVDTSEKDWRADERSNSLRWDADIQVGFEIWQLTPSVGWCWLGWESGGDLVEGKSSNGECYGLRWRSTDGRGRTWMIRATTAEFETYGAESDDRYTVDSYRLLFGLKLRRWDFGVMFGGGRRGTSRGALAIRRAWGN